jgi:multiple sugar transport system permease protein
VLLTTILSLTAAVLLNEKIKFRNIFRAGFFFPVITSIIVISIIFVYIYSPYGLINMFIEKYFSAEKIDFLNKPEWALKSVILMTVWSSFGYYMLLFLAGLQSIPEELYESAEIDGANSVQKFFSITIPQLKPIMLFVLVINTIRSLQIFSEIFVMTKGGPLGSTTTAVYYLYNHGFSGYRMGYASSAAYILFIIIVVLCFIQFRFIKYSRNY